MAATSTNSADSGALVASAPHVDGTEQHLKRSSTWKRMTSIYSSSSLRQKEDPDASFDLWDNNDDDFQREISREKDEKTAAGMIRASAQSPSATTVEEVRSPNSTRSTFEHSSPEAVNAPPLFATLPPGRASPPSHLQQSSQTCAVPVQRPVSASGHSVFSSPIYSLVSSEGSSALTFPSPGSSLAEMRKNHRYSGNRAQFLGPSVASSREASPTCTNFSQEPKVRRSSADVGSANPTQAVQLGGWTQEQISAPIFPPVAQVSGPKAVLGVSRTQSGRTAASQEGRPRRSRSNAGLNSPICLSKDERVERSPTAAELVRNEALNALKDGEESLGAPTIMTRSGSLGRGDEACHSQLDGKEGGLFSALKKKLTRTPSRASVRPEGRIPTTNAGDRPTQQPKSSRLTLTASTEPTSYGTMTPKSQSLRHPSIDSQSRRLGSPVQQGSQAQWHRYNDHENAFDGDSRDQKWSTLRQPRDSVDSTDGRSRAMAHKSNPSVTHPVSPTSSQRNVKRTSIPSSISSHVQPPPRPARTEGDQILGRKPSLTSAAASPRLSLESTFNAVHDRRWSTVGSSLSHSTRRGSDAHSLLSGSLRRGSDVNTSGRFAYDPSKRLSGLGLRDTVGPPRDPLVSWERDDLMSQQRAVPTEQTNDFASGTPFELPKHDHRRVEQGGERGLKARKSSRLSKLLPVGRSLTKKANARADDLDEFSQMAEDPYADRTVVPYTASEMAERYSPASEAFTAQSSSLDRTSMGSTLSVNLPYQAGGTPMRTSRSTNDLVQDSSDPWRSATNTKSHSNLAAIPSNSSSSLHKRPTFGLDLQPDAAAAFDSIPLPATPEQRSRSRLPSITQQGVDDSASTRSPALPSARTADNLDHHAETICSKAETESILSHHERQAMCVPDDLPADVEDLEDLVEDDSTMTVNDESDQTLRLSRPQKQSHAALKASLGTSGADEVELLEDDDGQGENHSPALMDSSEGPAGPTVEHLAKYRFPPNGALPSSEEHNHASLPQQEQHWTPTFGSPDLVGEHLPPRSPVPLSHPDARTSVCSLTSASLTNIASHLRRPSSSSSFI